MPGDGTVCMAASRHPRPPMLWPTIKAVSQERASARATTPASLRGSAVGIDGTSTAVCNELDQRVTPRDLRLRFGDRDASSPRQCCSLRHSRGLASSHLAGASCTTSPVVFGIDEVALMQASSSRSPVDWPLPPRGAFAVDAVDGRLPCISARGWIHLSGRKAATGVRPASSPLPMTRVVPRMVL